MCEEGKIGRKKKNWAEMFYYFINVNSLISARQGSNSLISARQGSFIYKVHLFITWETAYNFLKASVLLVHLSLVPLLLSLTQDRVTLKVSLHVKPPFSRQVR